MNNNNESYSYDYCLNRAHEYDEYAKDLYSERDYRGYAKAEADAEHWRELAREAAVRDYGEEA